MPPVAKKNKTVKAKTIKAEKKIKTEPESEPQTVISGQLQKQINNKKLKKLPQKNRNRGVVFVKNLPHGFFEEQMRKYFEQFGKVTRLRLARSRRTGNSKGFAFVEFAVPEVAEIAANTMNNYLMFQKIVKTAYIPPEKQKYNYFKSKVHKVVNNVGKEIYVSNKTKHIAREMRAYNKWDDEAQKKRVKSNLKKLNKLKKKCEVNIDFNKLILGLDSSQSDNELQNRTDENDSSIESKKSKKIEKFKRIEEKITAESSDNSSKDSDSSKCENLLLVKKRKRNMNDTNSSQDSKTINDNKKSKKSLDTSDSKSEDKEKKQNIKSKLSKSVSSTSLASSSSSNDLQNTFVDKTSNLNEDDSESDDDSEEDDIDMIKMKKNKTKKQQKKKEIGLDAIIKKKPLLGGIQKAKNIKNNNHKLIKIKEQNNDQNEKLKKSLIEASLKEMMKMTNIKNKTEKKSFQKVRKTKKN